MVAIVNLFFIVTFIILCFGAIATVATAIPSQIPKPPKSQTKA